MAQRAEIIATYFTLAGDIKPFDAVTISPRPLVERARAAAAGGYGGMGFGAQDIAHLLERHGAAGVNAILGDHGIVHRELEVLVGWFDTGEARAASDRERRALLAAAEAIGARHIKVGGDLRGLSWPMDHLIAEFARLCDEAAEAGSAITIELFPSSNLSELQAGRALVEGAGRANGGLLLDIWHMVRGRVTMAGIAALPPGIVNHVELDDGPLEARGDYLAETIGARLAPGEGEFPLDAFLAALRASGYAGLYGVELLSDEWRTMPLDRAARRSGEAARALLGGRREG